MSLKYKRNHQLREEIVSSVGAGYDGRFERDDGAGIRKQNLVLVAQELRPDTHTFAEKTIADLTISELYSLIGEWVGVEYTGCSGNDWAFNRPHLKAIHQEIHDD